jgi:hypothetical protein
MSPRELCWCGSEKLWVKCHKGRSKEREISLREAFARLAREHLKGRCSHPDAPGACKSAPIRAHSLQRSSVLSAIAENGHVYSARSDILENGLRDIRKVGVRTASTFFGFCSYHDDSLFKPIERGELALDQKTAFLLSFRAVSMEVLVREASIRGMAAVHMDAGKSLRQQEQIVNKIQQDIVPIIRGAHDFRDWKLRLDRKYSSGSFHDMNMLVVEFDDLMPIVSSAAIQPWFDFEGNRLQDLIHTAEPDQLAFSLTCVGGASVLIFCWERDDNLAAKKLVDSFLKQPDRYKATAAALLAMGYSENTYLRMSWWDALQPRQQERVHEVIQFGTCGPEHRAIRARVMNTSISPIRINVGVRGTRRV